MIGDIDQLVLSCVLGVFRTMLNLDVVPFAPGTVNRALKDREQQVAAAVGFSGAVTGVAYIYCSSSFAVQCSAVLLGSTIRDTSADEIVNDMMGEIANMVVGKLKSGLCDRGLICVLGTPSVVRGTFSIESLSLSERRVMNFTCDGNSLTVEIMLKLTDSKLTAKNR